MSSPCIDLEHVRRSRRLLSILVDRFGVAHFLESRTDARRIRRGERVSARACDDAVALATTWIERRTGREVEEEIVRMMRRDLERILMKRITEGAACIR